MQSLDDRVHQLDPAFARLHAASTARAWELPQLTSREKVFLSVVGDVCNQTLGLPFELHVRHGLRHGVTVDDVRDLLRTVAFETGYPAALAALERLAEIEQGQGAAPAPHNAAAPPPAVRAQWQAVDPHFAGFMELQAGMVGEVTGLSVRERAFAALTCDVMYQTLDETFAVHTGRALAAGATADDIRAVVRFASQLGVTRTWNAFRALERLSSR